MINTSPLISVITVVKNRETYLTQCIESVICQTYQNFEYIIIDGQSTDGTLNIIKKYEQYLSKWISESDTGIAEAMNKGLTHAKGKFILFLHADDYLIDENAFERVKNFINESIDILACSIFFETEQQRYYRRSQWNAGMYLKNKIFHQGVLCNYSVFEKLGNFDPHFKIAMDYDFFLRAYYNREIKVKIIDDVLTVMRNTGISSQTDWKSLKLRFNEEKKVHFKNCHSSLGKTLYRIYWLCYFFYRYLLRTFK